MYLVCFWVLANSDRLTKVLTAKKSKIHSIFPFTFLGGSRCPAKEIVQRTSGKGVARLSWWSTFLEGKQLLRENAARKTHKDELKVSLGPEPTWQHLIIFKGWEILFSWILSSKSHGKDAEITWSCKVMRARGRGKEGGGGGGACHRLRCCWYAQL